jgi:GNAT superfamily N-acetyltransferase
MEVNKTYFYWHVHGNNRRYELEDVVVIWETASGDIASMMNPESPGEVFVQIHPSYWSPELEAEMIEFAEKNLAVINKSGRLTLTIWAHEEDKIRSTILQQRGYKQGEFPEYQRRRSLSQSVPSLPIATGFRVRAQRGKEELPARAMASWKAFHPAAPIDDYGGWDWYLNIWRAPLYRRDLDIVAVAPDGQIASFCTAWYDDVTRTGAFEPVGTSPEYQRLGLGKAVTAEGLQRVVRMGATLATVSSFTPPAHALYSAMGFQDYSLMEPCVKELKNG